MNTDIKLELLRDMNDDLDGRIVALCTVVIALMKTHPQPDQLATVLAAGGHSLAQAPLDGAPFSNQKQKDVAIQMIEWLSRAGIPPTSG